MSITLEDVIDYLERLPSEELGKLADEVLARLGAPPIARYPRPGHVMGGVPPSTETMGEAPMFALVLRGHGPNKLEVVLIVRKMLGLKASLQDAKRLVESAPVVLLEDLSRNEAMDAADVLREAGADVHLR